MSALLSRGWKVNMYTFTCAHSCHSTRSLSLLRKFELYTVCVIVTCTRKERHRIDKRCVLHAYTNKPVTDVIASSPSPFFYNRNTSLQCVQTIAFKTQANTKYIGGIIGELCVQV